MSIEDSWKKRFMLACHNLSRLTGREIIPSATIRPFIIKLTLKYEAEIEKRQRTVPSG